MKTYTISALAKRFGLSRSALIYYDKIGLLAPAGRTPAEYRFYTDREAQRLTRICNFRDAGLELKQIQKLLCSQEAPPTDILQDRLMEIDNQIMALHTKRVLLSGMLQGVISGQDPQYPDRTMWVEMLRAAGMDDRAMEIWHAEFERRAPETHHRFLTLLNISEEEIRKIRQWAGSI